MKKILPAALLGLFLLSATAFAADDPKLMGAFGSWKTYSFMDGANKICFMSAKPTEQKSKATIKKRSDVLLFVTHWSNDKTKNVVSVSAGYPYRTDSEAILSVDGKKFKLATEGETAWSKDQPTDDAVTDAIRKGASLTVDGESKRGTKTTDVYDLKGSSDAYDAIAKECNFQ
jgi:hypothetical protein